MSYEETLEVLGDPMRRRILEELRREPMPVGELARRLPISRPAVSRHLRVLGGAALVRHEPRGTSNVYHVDRDGLRELRTWVDAWWDEPLARFAAHVEETSREH